MNGCGFSSWVIWWEQAAVDECDWPRFFKQLSHLTRKTALSLNPLDYVRARLFFGFGSSTALGVKLGVYHSVIILSDVCSFPPPKSQNFSIVVHDPLILLVVAHFSWFCWLWMLPFFVSLFQMNSILVLFLA